VLRGIEMLFFIEMSKELKKQGAEIGASRFRIFEHLFKLFYFRDNKVWQSDWMKHLAGNTPTTYYLPRSKKLPKQRFIYDNLWKDGEDSFSVEHGMFQKIMSILEEDYDLSPIRKNPKLEEFMAFCNDYCLWVSDMLSKQLNVKYGEVKPVIIELLKKYPYKLT
jgi:hypothetical protein